MSCKQQTMGAGVLNLINRQFGVQRIYTTTMMYTRAECVCVFAPCSIYRYIDDEPYIRIYYYAYIVIGNNILIYI